MVEATTPNCARLQAGKRFDVSAQRLQARKFVKQQNKSKAKKKRS
jgi:hypothetical protein